MTGECELVALAIALISLAIAVVPIGYLWFLVIQDIVRPWTRDDL